MVGVGEELREIVSVQVLVLEACRTEDRLLIGEVVGERVYPYGSGKALLRCCLFYWDICYLSILDSCQPSSVMLLGPSYLVEEIDGQTMFALELAAVFPAKF